MLDARDGCLQFRCGQRRGHELGDAGAHGLEHQDRFERGGHDDDASGRVLPAQRRDCCWQDGPLAQIEHDHRGLLRPRLCQQVEIVELQRRRTEAARLRQLVELAVARPHDSERHGTHCINHLISVVVVSHDALSSYVGAPAAVMPGIPDHVAVRDCGAAPT